VATLPQLPAFDGPSVLTENAASPKAQIEASRTRLKGAFGDASIGAEQPCHAGAAEKADYKGDCPVCHAAHAIANTTEAKQQARLLFKDVKANGAGPDLPYSKLDAKGNMFGVLIAVDNEGKTHVLKAFSGRYNDTDKYDAPGFAPPVPCVNPLQNEELCKKFDEAEAALKEFETNSRSVNLASAETALLFKAVDKSKKAIAQNKKQVESFASAISSNQGLLDTLRGAEVPDAAAIGKLEKKITETTEKQSNLAKSIAETELALAADIAKYDKLKAASDLLKSQQAAKYGDSGKLLKAKEDALKRVRDEASAAVLNDFATNRTITNYTGATRDFASAVTAATPVEARRLAVHGQCGWCAAPKLLAEAKAKGLTPVSMSEFWMGKPAGSNVEGAIVPSCEFCQSFIGFSLCGLDAAQKETEGTLQSKSEAL